MAARTWHVLRTIKFPFITIGDYQRRGEISGTVRVWLWGGQIL